MQISKAKDKDLLKKMEDAVQRHIARCKDEESDDYNPERIKFLEDDLAAVQLRLEELEQQ